MGLKATVSLARRAAWNARSRQAGFALILQSDAQLLVARPSAFGINPSLSAEVELDQGTRVGLGVAMAVTSFYGTA